MEKHLHYICYILGGISPVHTCIFQFISSSEQRLVKSSVSHQMIEMTAYSDDMCLNLERKKSGDEDTTNSGSYSEMC